MKNIEWKLVRNEEDIQGDMKYTDIMYSSLFETYICNIDGLDVGYINIEKDDNHITDIVVLSKYRGKGYGKILLNKCIEEGCNELEVTTDNKIAISLYKSFGFDIIDVDKRNVYYTMKL